MCLLSVSSAQLGIGLFIAQGEAAAVPSCHQAWQKRCLLGTGTSLRPQLLGTVLLLWHPRGFEPLAVRAGQCGQAGVALPGKGPPQCKGPRGRSRTGKSGVRMLARTLDSRANWGIRLLAGSTPSSCHGVSSLDFQAKPLVSFWPGAAARLLSPAAPDAARAW